MALRQPVFPAGSPGRHCLLRTSYSDNTNNEQLMKHWPYAFFADLAENKEIDFVIEFEKITGNI
jgi:hypothetical protein